MSKNGTRWHHSVWAGRRPFRFPACWVALGITDRLDGYLIETGVLHGHTMVRGNVNCPDCLRMMGNPEYGH